MKLTAILKLAHVNLRREKAGAEDGDIGTDIKLTGRTHLKDLKDLFKDDHSFAMLEGLYDAEGNLRTLAFAKFDLTAKGIGIDVTLATEIAERKVKLQDAEVDKFTLVADAGRQIDLTFRVKANPSDTQVALLAEMLSSDLKVTLYKRQGELSFGQPAEAPEEDEEKEEETETAE